MIGYLVLVPVSYLLGSLPIGLIAGWVFKRVDVREHGSGKTGMTNVLRTAGGTAAALVLLLDMGKAVLAVALARVFTDTPGVEAAAALSALIGHNWSVFIRFQGGRGTSPGWGALFILSPIAGLVATVIGLSLVAATRYVSLGSVMAASLGSITLIILSVMGYVPIEYMWFGIIGGSLVVVNHRDNIQRLIKGTERKIGQAADTIQGETKAERRKGLRWSKSA